MRKFGLKCYRVVNFAEIIAADGTIQENILFIGGMPVKKARAHIISLLQEKDLLIKQEKIRHMVAIHERCGTDVEFLPEEAVLDTWQHRP